MRDARCAVRGVVCAFSRRYLSGLNPVFVGALICFAWLGPAWGTDRCGLRGFGGLGLGAVGCIDLSVGVALYLSFALAATVCLSTAVDD